MRNKKMITGLMVGLLVVVLASQSLAMGRRPARPQGPGHERMAQGIIKKLDLTDEQKARFKAEQEKMKQAMEASHKKVKELADKMKAELEKDAPDRKKVHAYIDQMSKLRKEMQIRRMDSLLDLRQTLTPEQRSKFKKMLEQGRQRFDKKPGKRSPKRK